MKKVLRTRMMTVAVVLTICLFVVSILLLRDINPSNWQEVMITYYFPILVIPAACIYLITLVFRVHKLETEVSEANHYDPLTHTLKTTPLIKRAEDTYKNTDLRNRPISLLCMGVDRVTAIEEEYGKEAVKAVLREFGGTVIGATREDDLIGRLEENVFVAVAMNTPSKYALPVVARFQELAHADLVLVNDTEVRYSICVGYASSDHGEGDPPDFKILLERATKALDSAKKEGPASVQGWFA